MTVIKGYLTMLEAGTLGDTAPKARSVLPLLIAKSDEVNWMVEQMIEAARLEEGRLALKKERSRHRRADRRGDRRRANCCSAITSSSVEKPVEAIEAEVDPDRFQIVVRNLLEQRRQVLPAGTRHHRRVTAERRRRASGRDRRGHRHLAGRPGAAVHALRPHRDQGHEHTCRERALACGCRVRSRACTMVTSRSSRRSVAAAPSPSRCRSMHS